MIASKVIVQTARFGALAGLAFAGACNESPTLGAPGIGAPSAACIIPETQIFDGGPGKDGIPALTNPRLVGIAEAGTEYLADRDRVIGLIVDGQPIAVPHNIGWWHEIVNFDFPNQRLAVTYCPLTGSSLVFDRQGIGGAELGVSGLLFRNNLIMYDRTSQESLWPQMMRTAACGPRVGTDLRMVAAVEMTWAGWRTLHPETRVIADDPRNNRNYRLYPYGNYEDPDNPRTLFPMPNVDTRRPPKERVLGIAVANSDGLAFPFGELDTLGAIAAVHALAGEAEVVVFWDRERRAASAHRPRAGERSLSFSVRDGQVLDAETGSVWSVDGRAVDGPLAGERLAGVDEAFVSFWFAWAAFHPRTILWQAGG
jgi:hypothetical protein